MRLASDCRDYVYVFAKEIAISDFKLLTTWSIYFSRKYIFHLSLNNAFNEVSV